MTGVSLRRMVCKSNWKLNYSHKRKRHGSQRMRESNVNRRQNGCVWRASARESQTTTMVQQQNRWMKMISYLNWIEPLFRSRLRACTTTSSVYHEPIYTPKKKCNRRKPHRVYGIRIHRPDVRDAKIKLKREMGGSGGERERMHKKRIIIYSAI